MTSVGVVIPTYNRSQVLLHVLPSYLSSCLVTEVVIVDDASTDDTQTRVAELAKSDPRILYIRNECNHGAPFSRNRGASQLSTDWILESEDDLALAPNCMETLLAHAEASGADIIAGRRVWMRLGESEDQALTRANLNQRPLFNEWLMDHNSHGVASKDIETPLVDGTMLIRRGLFDRIQYYEPYGGQSTWREESDFQLSALELGHKLIFCPHAITFHYSRASQSFGRNRIKGTVVYAYRVYRNNLAFLRRHHAYLRAHYPKSLLVGSPELSALLYGAYRTAWLIAAETLRFIRARKYGGFSWK